MVLLEGVSTVTVIIGCCVSVLLLLITVGTIIWKLASKVSQLEGDVKLLTSKVELRQEYAVKQDAFMTSQLADIKQDIRQLVNEVRNSKG